ncbi:MAG: CheR family methyltransferase, partial [Bacteroidota bacterium]
MSDFPKINESVIGDILDYLSEVGKVDWRPYKRATLSRRIHARKTRIGAESLEAYLKQLQVDSEERELLLGALCIDFSSFFRDEAVFKALEAFYLRDLLLRNDHQEIRIWIPGCAKGQEAYSIALLLEALKHETGSNRNYLIFATDIKTADLQYARKGLYTAGELEPVPAKLRAAYFQEATGEFKIDPTIRKKIIFSDHNLVNSPPFSRLDLISCRNVLIYFRPHIQQLLMDRFKRSLQPHGLLLLGKDEHPNGLEEHFQDEKAVLGLYRRKPSDTYPSTGPQEVSSNMKIVNHIDKIEDGFWKEVPFQNLIYKFYSPPLLIVDEQGNLLHLTNAALDFVELPNDLGQFPPLDSFLSAGFTDKIKLAIRSLKETKVHRFEGKAETIYKEQTLRINFNVEPFRARKTNKKLFTVTLAKNHFDSPLTSEASPPTLLEDPVYLGLFKELEHAEKQLNHALSEVDQSRKDLVTKNEELISANEEFQSLNEELVRFNEASQRSIFNLREQNKDLDFLLKTTDIGMILLDSDDRIQKFTSSVVHIFPLLESDLGRPIHHISHNLDYPNLAKHIVKVKKEKKAFETEVSQLSNGQFFVRILPHLSEEEQFLGLVLCFIDVSEKNDVLRDQSLAAMQFEALSAHATLAMFRVSGAGLIVESNPQFRALTGLDTEQLLDQKLETLIYEPDRNDFILFWHQVLNAGKAFRVNEFRITHTDQSTSWVRLLSCPLPAGERAVQDQHFLMLAVNVDRFKKAFLATERRYLQFQAIFEQNGVAIGIGKPSGQLLEVNKAFADLFGYTKDEILKLSVHELTDPDHQDETKDWLE